MKSCVGAIAVLLGLGSGLGIGVRAQSAAQVSVAQPTAQATVVQTPVPQTPPPGQTPAGPTTMDDRWSASLDAFAAADRLHAPTPGGIVFVGSSSIRLWSDLENQFGSNDITKRGFGGSRLADCARHVAELVLPYKPRLVVMYAGDNDLAEGRSPYDVLESFAEFVTRVREALPSTRIAYMSIKPSPLRASLMPKIIETNTLIEHYIGTVPNLDYIDVYTEMLDAQGHPRADLFQADKLHLNAQGYALWRSTVADHLRPVATTSAP